MRRVDGVLRKLNILTVYFKHQCLFLLPTICTFVFIFFLPFTVCAWLYGYRHIPVLSYIFILLFPFSFTHDPLSIVVS